LAAGRDVPGARASVRGFHGSFFTFDFFLSSCSIVWAKLAAPARP